MRIFINFKCNKNLLIKELNLLLQCISRHVLKIKINQINSLLACKAKVKQANQLAINKLKLLYSEYRKASKIKKAKVLCSWKALEIFK